MKKVIKTWKNCAEPESLVLMSDDCHLFVAMDCASEKIVPERVVLSKCIPVAENEQVDVFCFSSGTENKSLYLAVKKEPDGTRRLLFEFEFEAGAGIWLIKSAVVFVASVAVRQMFFQDEVFDLMRVRAFSSVDGRELSCRFPALMPCMEIFVNVWGNLMVSEGEVALQYGVRGDELAEIPFSPNDWRAQLHNCWNDAASLGFDSRQIISLF